ncbi:MAG: hypothetical protein JO048_10550 [Methylobacteriaceae bacterium]|nr:hypothetical protein [Methylobacteriaceae bacterium]
MADRSRTRPAIGDRAAAEALVAGTLAATDAMAEALATEAALVAEGRIRAGLAEAPRKAEAAANYLRALEAAKANAIALKRLVPDLLPELRAAQERVQDEARRNQAILGTARAVADGLIRSLADELTGRTRPQAYAPPRRSPERARPAEPIAFSGRF